MTNVDAAIVVRKVEALRKKRHAPIEHLIKFRKLGTWRGAARPACGRGLDRASWLGRRRAGGKLAGGEHPARPSCTPRDLRSDSEALFLDQLLKDGLADGRLTPTLAGAARPPASQRRRCLD